MTPTPPAALTVTRHPPEHGRAGPPEMLPAGCCCCCCCCCLHTLGGVGGAVLGSSTRIETHPVRNTDPNSPFPYRLDVFEEDQPLVPPVLLYWMLVLLTVAGCVAVAPLLVAGGGTPPAPQEYIAIGLFIAVMVLPGLQLLASLLAFLVVAVFYPERSYALRRIGRITLWSFAGMALGLLLMGGCLAVLVVANR